MVREYQVFMKKFKKLIIMSHLMRSGSYSGKIGFFKVLTIFVAEKCEIRETIYPILSSRDNKLPNVEVEI